MRLRDCSAKEHVLLRNMRLWGWICRKGGRVKTSNLPPCFHGPFAWQSWVVGFQGMPAGTGGWDIGVSWMKKIWRGCPCDTLVVRKGGYRGDLLQWVCVGMDLEERRQTWMSTVRQLLPCPYWSFNSGYTECIFAMLGTFHFMLFKYQVRYMFLCSNFVPKCSSFSKILSMPSCAYFHNLTHVLVWILCMTYVQKPMELRRGYQIPWKWS